MAHKLFSISSTSCGLVAAGLALAASSLSNTAQNAGVPVLNLVGSQQLQIALVAAVIAALFRFLAVAFE